MLQAAGQEASEATIKRLATPTQVPPPPPPQDEDMDEAEKKWKSERRGGNYGAGTKEMQARNYVTRKEQERKRRELFDDALDKFKAGDIPVGGGRMEGGEACAAGLCWGGARVACVRHVRGHDLGSKAGSGSCAASPWLCIARNARADTAVAPLPFRVPPSECPGGL
jgi:hypothetical protein